MRLFIYPNRFNGEQILTVGACIRALSSNGMRCVVPEDLRLLLAPDVKTVEGDAVSCDAVVSIGGDGAVLRAAQIAVKADKPLFGINNGHVGYLCRFSLDEVAALNEETLKRLCFIPRSLLAFSVDGEEHFALNDIVIGKKDFSTAMRVSAKVGNAFVGKWHGDGVIVSTPTGSTAYNRSAGGPRLLQGSGCFTVNPICSYTSPNQAVVYSDREILQISFEESMMEPSLYADGVSYGALGSSIEIRRYGKDLNLATRD